METEMMQLALEFIGLKMVILVPTLFGLGWLIKHTSLLKDKYIPLLLLPAGIAGAIALGGFTANSVIQGILVTVITVYGHVTIKQLKKEE